MRLQVHFLLIPYFPVKPSINQLIYVERGYHPLFNEFLKQADFLKEFFVSIPDEEQKLYEGVSRDDFYDNYLSSIPNLYSFLDDAVLGTPFSNVYSWDEIFPFDRFEQSVDDVVKYGILQYTGLQRNDGLIFAYVSLVSDNLLDMNLKAMQAFVVLTDVVKDLRSKYKSPYKDLKLAALVVDRGPRLEKYGSSDTFFDYLNNTARRRWATISCNTARICNNNFRCFVDYSYCDSTFSISFTPEEFTLYATFLKAGKFMTKDEMYGNKHLKGFMQSVWNNVVKIEGRCPVILEFVNGKIVDSRFNKWMHSISTKIEKAFCNAPGVPKNIFLPYTVAERKSAGEYGVFVSTLPQSYRYITERVFSGMSL